MGLTYFGLDFITLSSTLFADIEPVLHPILPGRLGSALPFRDSGDFAIRDMRYLVLKMCYIVWVALSIAYWI
jgi:hypothetical protein